MGHLHNPPNKDDIPALQNAVSTLQILFKETSNGVRAKNISVAIECVKQVMTDAYWSGDTR